MCLYDAGERLLLRRVQISANRSLDGVLDQLSSRGVTDAGPAALIDDAPSDDEGGPLPPTTTGGRTLGFWDFKTLTRQAALPRRDKHF